MYDFVISKRYNALFRIELFHSSQLGKTPVNTIGSVPLVFRTDASARVVAKLIIKDIDSGECDHLLTLDGVNIVLSSYMTLQQIKHYWDKQNIALGVVEIKKRSTDIVEFANEQEVERIMDGIYKNATGV